MSTKSSLGYHRKEKTKTLELHVYEEMLDGKYYVSDGQTSFEVSEEVATLIGEVLTLLENPELSDKMKNLRKLLGIK